MIMATTEHAECLLPPIGGNKEFHPGQKAQQKTASIRSANKCKELLRISRELVKNVTWFP